MQINVWCLTIVILLVDRRIFGSGDFLNWVATYRDSIQLAGWSCRSVRRCLESGG